MWYIVSKRVKRSTERGRVEDEVEKGCPPNPYRDLGAFGEGNVGI
jgi:hypothetical protein